MGDLRQLKKKLSSVAPGLFMVGYVIGTGSVTTMVVAGARYNMSLTWALLLSCIFTAFLMIGISRLTMITGNSLIYNLKQHIHPIFSIFMIFALIVTAFTSIMGITAIATTAIQEWTKPITPSLTGLDPLISSFILIGTLYALFWYGKHETFLQFSTLMVAIMAFCFLLTMIMVIPNFKEVAKGLVPAIPKNGDPHIIIAGMVGTTMAGICLVSRSTIVKERGWQIGDIKEEAKDSINSMLITFIISAAIMTAAAGTLYVKGIYVDDAIEMMYTLEPLVGRFAISFFAIGILSAAFSSIFPSMVILPWLLNDFKGTSTSLKKPFYRIIVLILALGGFIPIILKSKPILVMILSQAVSPLIMPMLIGGLFYLLNNKQVMGSYKIEWYLNFSIVISFVFSIFISFISIQGFINVFSN
jgi:Mn2+/Fe2+ NRAMP family transporter